MYGDKGGFGVTGIREKKIKDRRKRLMCSSVHSRLDISEMGCFCAYSRMNEAKNTKETNSWLGDVMGPIPGFHKLDFFPLQPHLLSCLALHFTLQKHQRFIVTSLLHTLPPTDAYAMLFLQNFQYPLPLINLLIYAVRELSSVAKFPWSPIWT